MENDEYCANSEPLSPTLTGEELTNWKLNEVFQNLFDMENTEV